MNSILLNEGFCKIKRRTKAWIQQRSIIWGHTDNFSTERKNVQRSFQNTFLACGTFPLISPASAETLLCLSPTRVTQSASMFHDLCPLIWATKKKMNNHTLVTRLTFSRRATLFRAQSIKSDRLRLYAFAFAAWPRHGWVWLVRLCQHFAFCCQPLS